MILICERLVAMILFHKGYYVIMHVYPLLSMDIKNNENNMHDIIFFL